MIQPTQVTLYVNGKADPTTTTGVDSGAGQVSLRQIITLNAGDAITIVNHTSASGTIQTTQNAGGSRVGNNMQLTIYRIAPLPCILDDKPRRHK